MLLGDDALDLQLRHYSEGRQADIQAMFAVSICQTTMVLIMMLAEIVVTSLVQKMR